MKAVDFTAPIFGGLGVFIVEAVQSKWELGFVAAGCWIISGILNRWYVRNEKAADAAESEKR